MGRPKVGGPQDPLGLHSEFEVNLGNLVRLYIKIKSENRAGGEDLSGTRKAQGSSSIIIKILVYKLAGSPHLLVSSCIFLEHLLQLEVFSPVWLRIVLHFHHTHAWEMAFDITCFSVYQYHLLYPVLFIFYWINVLSEPKISTSWSNRHSYTLSSMWCWVSDPELTLSKKALPTSCDSSQQYGYYRK